jgi:hypothetical protein
MGMLFIMITNIRFKLYHGFKIDVNKFTIFIKSRLAFAKRPFSNYILY